jgi:hypothetical protein
VSRFANMMDTLQNLITGLGLQGVDSSTAAQYILELLDRATLENMYRGDWLSRKIIDQPADDLTREWRAWQASQKQIEALELLEKEMDLQRKVKQWIIKARLYGGSALIVGADDGMDASQPLVLEKCGRDSLKYVVVLHRWELNAGPRIYNVNDPYYTRPAYYTVATPMFGFMGEPGVTTPQIGAQPEQVPGAVKKPGFFGNIVPFRNKSAAELRNYSTIPTNMGMSQIHPSRVLELPGNELPDWRLAPMGGGWGDSVLQTVVDAMKSYTTTYQSIAAMVNDGKMDVVKIPEMSLKIKNADYKAKLIERFTTSVQIKSVLSALLLDKEEEWDRISTNYGGLPMIMHEFTTVISGAAEIPVSILFGQAYGRGMSGGSTGGGRGDARTYYDNCRTKQKNDIAPRLGMLDQLLMRSALGRADPNIHYEWKPLWQMDDDEKSKIGLAKAQSTQIYATIGLINEDAFREGVVNQLIEDGTYPGLDDAIEEYGSEPEEPEDTGGYVPGQPGGQPPPGGAAPPPKTAKPAVGAKLGDFDPDELRDPQGKWTSGSGGGGAAEGAAAEGTHPGKGYSKQAKVVNGVIQTSNVNDAVRALYEGRKVKLDQPRQVSTLLGKLASVAKEMEKLGAKAHNFNLCDVSVSGSNLFCAESKGIPRVKMPQLPDAKAFQDYLQKTGVGVTSTDEFASHLRATQDELNGSKVGGMMKAMREGKVKDERLIVSRDNYVVDGHHRWAATVGLDSENNKLGDIKMPVARVDMDIIPLLGAAEKFTGGAGHKGVGDRRRTA